MYVNRALAATILLVLGALVVLALPEQVTNVWYWTREMVSTAWSAAN